jgi:hypothetical protein
MLPAPASSESLTNTESIGGEIVTTRRVDASECPSNETTATTAVTATATIMTETGQQEVGHKRLREAPSLENLAGEDPGNPAKRLRSSSEITAKTLPAPDKSAPVAVTDDKPEIAASPTRSLSARTHTKHGDIAGVNSPSQKRLRNQKRWRGKFFCRNQCCF